MRIFRTIDIIFVLLMIVAAGVTYQVKYKAQAREKQIRRLHIAIKNEEDNIRELHALFAQLTQPERIAKLVAHYQQSLHLDILQPQQIVSLKELLKTLPMQKKATVQQATKGDTHPLSAGSEHRKNGVVPSAGSQP